MYTVLHIFRQVLFGAGNQGNHQNFEKSLLSYKCWLIFIGMKQKQIQNGRLKKTEIFNSPNTQYFFMKILWIGPRVSRIDWCEGHWCGSTYMVVRVSDISSNTGKKCIFCFLGHFWAYVGQPHDHIGWAKSMPSINPTNPRTPIHEI
jgi:hypothetical protein